MANVKTSAVAIDNAIANMYASYVGFSINKPPIATDNAISNMYASYPGFSINKLNTARDINNSYGGYGRGDTLANDLNLIGIIGVPDVSQPIYRGKLGGEYVYSIGSPPGGASDIIIVGYT